MGDLLTVSSTLMCPHGGMVTAIPSSGRVTLGGDPIVLATDTFVVAGCPFLIGIVPHPCVLVQWQLPAARSTSGQVATLTTESVGFCNGPDGAMQGTVLVQATQTRVEGL